jgi:hypothetical protein
VLAAVSFLTNRDNNGQAPLSDPESRQPPICSNLVSPAIAFLRVLGLKSSRQEIDFRIAGRHLSASFFPARKGISNPIAELREHPQQTGRLYKVHVFRTRRCRASRNVSAMRAKIKDVSDKNLSGSADDHTWSSLSGNEEPVPNLDAGSLKEILDVIVNASEATGELSASDRLLQQQLQSVAAEYPDQPLTLSPAVTSMIEVLAKGFGVLTETQRSQMIAAVARTLYDDSGSRNRLERLWKTLQRAAL